MSGGRTKVRAGVVAVCVAMLGSLLVSGSAAAMGGFHLRLSRSAGLRDGQTIDYEVTGQAVVPSRVVEVWQCDAAADLDLDSTAADVSRWCALLDFQSVEPPGGSVSGSVLVHEVFTTFPTASEPSDVIHCGDRPHDCVLAAITWTQPPDGGIEALDVRSIGMIPSPVAVGGPGVQDESGLVEVWIAGDRGATRQLAQCAHFPGVPRSRDTCRPGPEVVLSRSGRAMVEMQVVPVLEVGPDRTLDCRARPCEVTLFDRAGRVVGAATIPGSVPAVDVTIEPDTGLTHGDVVQVRFESTIPPGVSYAIGLCLSSVLEGGSPTASCHVYSSLVGPGVQVYELPVYEHFTPYAGGPEVSCGYEPGACLVGVGNESVANGYAPITFAAPGAG